MADPTGSGDERGGTAPDLTVVFPETFRKKRMHLPAPVRHFVVIALGSLVGLMASYSLRYIGW